MNAMLSKLAVRRLTKLADFMESVPRERFDMSAWFAHEGADHDHSFGDFIAPSDLHACGTTACALGWASVIPSFRRGGLRVPTASVGGVLSTAMDFFNLGWTEARTLFDCGPFDGGINNHIKTPKQWAKHCRKFIRENT